MTTIEQTWEFYATNERDMRYGNILHSYDKYVALIDDKIELASLVGSQYFLEDVCIDEIMEMFREMVCSGRSSGLIHHVSFVYFFIKKALFNKMITRDEFIDIYSGHIGECEQLYSSTKTGSCLRPYTFGQLKSTIFLKKLIECNTGNNSEVEDDMVYDILVSLLQKCKY